MKKPKFIVEIFDWLFEEPTENDKRESRRLSLDRETGKLSWSKGDKPLGEGPDEEPELKPFMFEDDKEKGTRMFEPIQEYEPYRKNRFKIEFPGIPSYFFQSYNYMGTDVHSERKFFVSKKTIKDDYSSFNLLMLFPAEIDICEKLKELEVNPKVGEIKIHLLDPTGITVKTIIIPECEVTEIKAFRNLEYGNCGDNSDSLLYGEIIVKHKQRKLI